jgi:hypothetical protein
MLKIKPRALVRKLEFSNDGLRRILEANALGSSAKSGIKCRIADVTSREHSNKLRRKRGLPRVSK